jgi:hypothetical protein
MTDLENEGFTFVYSSEKSRTNERVRVETSCQVIYCED